MVIETDQFLLSSWSDARRRPGKQEQGLFNGRLPFVLQRSSSGLGPLSASPTTQELNTPP